MDENEIPSSQLPPGIRFHPSDEELISFYLERKMKSLPLPPNVITDIELYSYDPWDLPRNTIFGEDECYFFTPRDRKYPNGGRPNRAAVSGYWKATGTDQPIRSSFGARKIGVKKGLVFYKGKPPSGNRMDWIMTEYRLPDTSRPSRSTGGSMRLDDWVLCRIRQKGNMSKNEIWDEPNNSSCSSQIHKKNPERARDMLSDYLQSNEYNLIVSLLAGHDPAALSTPTTIFPCLENGSGSRGTEPDIYSDWTQSNEQISYGTHVQLHSNMIGQSRPLVSTSDGRSYGQYVPEGNKCKPRYLSNGCISFQELDQENFMQ